MKIRHESVTLLDTVHHYRHRLSVWRRIKDLHCLLDTVFFGIRLRPRLALVAIKIAMTTQTVTKGSWSQPEWQCPQNASHTFKFCTKIFYLPLKVRLTYPVLLTLVTRLDVEDLWSGLHGLRGHIIKTGYSRQFRSTATTNNQRYVREKKSKTCSILAQMFLVVISNIL